MMKKLPLLPASAAVCALAFGAVAMTTVTAKAATPAMKTASYAGGCFWTMEHDMEPIPGVVDVVSGYEGGKAANPSYENHEGFLETVRVTYDPRKISYPQLTARYLRITDPTDSGGAFCDRGPSYAPAIFVADAGERVAALAAIKAAQPHVKAPIVTKVLPATTFYKAEGYHQDYAKKNPVSYRLYRAGCGKDRAIKAVWS
jgi:peptide-methionine (S)-S-oxide reductase